MASFGTNFNAFPGLGDDFGRIGFAFRPESVRSFVSITRWGVMVRFLVDGDGVRTELRPGRPGGHLRVPSLV